MFHNLATGYRFSESHEWASLDGSKATIGVTNYAQVQMRKQEESRDYVCIKLRTNLVMWCMLSCLK